MNDRTLQKKRRAAANGSLMILHSKTSPRRKQRVAAGSAQATDLGSEVPNLGVARALFVILVLHVAAIAAIFVHNKVTDDDPVVSKSEVKEVPKALAVGPVEPEQPKVQQGEDYYFVATGDSYERIARSKNVEVGALKELNNNVDLRAGRILRLPTASVMPAAVHAPAESIASVLPAPAGRLPEVPRAQIVEEEPPAAEVAVVEEAAAEEAVRVTPKTVPPVAVIVAEETAPAAETALRDGGQRYKVKPGDSIWGISRKYSVSQEDILSINGIADPKKLRAGMELKIPAKN